MGKSDRPGARAATGVPVAISVLVTDGCLASSVSALCDVFELANVLLDQQQRLDPSGSTARFVVTLVAARAGPVRLSSGLIAGEVASPDRRCDVLVVPSLGNCGPGTVLAIAARLQAERDLIAGAVAAGVRTASVCTGTFLVASAGALEQQEATVSWMFKPAFEAAYPNVLVQPDQSVVRSASSHLSSGGVASAYDIALALIAEFAEDDIRRRVAAVLLADASRMPQWPVRDAGTPRQQAADVAGQAKAWVERHAAAPISAWSVANACNVTTRTLARHLRKTFDMTATEVIQQARVRIAMQLMQVSQLSFAEITAQCGVRDPATFRKVFKQMTGSTPMQYRKKYGNLGA